MKCNECGISYRVDDAKSQFDANYDYHLSYYVEITLEMTPPERNLCGDCAIDYLETKIRNQPGYEEPKSW